MRNFQTNLLYLALDNFQKLCDVEQQEKQESSKPKSLLASNELLPVWASERWHE